MPLKKMMTFLRGLTKDRNGNVLMMTGFAVIPLSMAVGMGVDYAQAARLRTKLNAAADAASLAAVSQPLMSQSNATAVQTATNIFLQQSSGLGGLIFDPSNLKVDIKDGAPAQNGVTVTSRTAIVSYVAQSKNNFAGILSIDTLPLVGSSKSEAAVAPNIDFYIALDTSPSMAFATTTAGIAQMRSLTGCAFACHITTPTPENGYTQIMDNNKFNIVKTMNVKSGSKTIIDKDGTYVDSSLYVRDSDGSNVDSLWLARNKGINMRIDAERTAVADLMIVAADTEYKTGANYQAALYTFDYKGNKNTKIASLTDNLPAVATASSKVELMKQNPAGCPDGSSCNGYLETSFYDVLDKMNNSAVIPAPGNGAPLNKPQAILFMITDGVSDEDVGTGRTRSEILASHVTQCQAIKDRGIRIAILYTEYLVDATTGNGSQGTDVAKRLPYVAPALTKCASPGLMYTVSTNQSISTALTALFKQAVSTARITK